MSLFQFDEIVGDLIDVKVTNEPSEEMQMKRGIARHKSFTFGAGI